MVEKRNKRSLNSETVKKSLIRARAIIKKKIRELHNQRLTFDHRINEEYKPIVEPLKSLVGEKKEHKHVLQKPKKEVKEESEIFEPASIYKTANKTAAKRLRFDEPNLSGINLMSPNESGSDSGPSFDSPSKLQESIIEEVSVRRPSPYTYGFRFEGEKLLLGKYGVTVKNDKYVVNGKSFPISKGLTELLLRENPEQYDDKDLKVYKNMLSHTSAHKIGYTRNEAIARNASSNKYNNIIAKLFPNRATRSSSSKSKSSKGGGCIKKPQMDFKTLDRTKKIDYTYWDDPNELVDRLRLLLASQSAGHTGMK